MAKSVVKSGHRFPVKLSLSGTKKQTSYQVRKPWIFIITKIVNDFMTVNFIYITVAFVRTLTWLRGFLVYIDVISFLPKSLLGIERQWGRELFAVLSLKPRSHVRILIDRTRAIILSKMEIKLKRKTLSLLQNDTFVKQCWCICPKWYSCKSWFVF